MKWFMGLCLLLVLGGRVHGQTLIVLDDQTGLPVELALVTAPNIKSLLFTDVNGEVDITALAGSDTLMVQSLGYEYYVSGYAALDAVGFVVRLRREKVQLEEVIVAASRWGQLARDVPARVNRIGERDIMLQRPQTAADMLAGSGEVFVQKSQLGGGSPMIRGFATNRLLYAVDGVRMNTAIFRAGNLQNVINLDPFATESVEVIFGPGSVMYGSDAIGGVMSFQTLMPRLAEGKAPLVRGKAVLQTASANKEFTAHFDVQAGWKKWALVTSISSFDFQDLRMGSYGPDEYLRPFYVARIDSTDVVVDNDDPLVQRPTGYGQINFMQKVRFKPSADWDLQYALHYSTTTSYPRYDRHIRYRNGKPRYGEWDYGPQRWLLSQFTATHHANSAFFDDAAVRVAYQLFEESRYDRDFQDNERHARVEQVDAWSVNLDFAKKFASGLQLYYGLETVLNVVDSKGEDQDILTGESVPGPSRYPQADWASYGAYAQVQKRYNSRWLLQAGARLAGAEIDAVFDTTFYPFPYTTADLASGALTGSLGTTFTPNDAWTLRANLSTGYRAPNVDDMGKVFDSEPGTVIVPNPDLKAEYAWNAEAGAAWRIGRVTLNATAYYTLLSNAMVRRPFTLNGMDSISYDGELSEVMAIQNAAKATVYGLQGGVDIDFGSGFYASADINYQVGEEELDDGSTAPSRHAPPVFGRVELGYALDRLRLVANVQFSGKKDFDDLAPEEQDKPEIYAIDDLGRPWSPAWTTVNLRAMYSIEGKFTFTAGLENILDVRYRPYSSGIVAPGRNATLAVQVAF